jgi:hypothetical protein
MTLTALARVRAPLLGLAVVGLLAACGGGSAAEPSVATLAGANPDTIASAAPSAATDDDGQQAYLDFAQCMREEGIDFPDPQFDANGQIQLGAGGRAANGLDFRNEDFQAAFEKCQDKLQGLGPNFDPQQQAELQDSLVEFAQCMRDNGVDMADPQPGSGGGFALGGPNADTDFNSPEFKAAQAKCQDKLGQLSFPGGPGSN